MHTSYIHTYINTCIHTYINSFILTTFIHTYIHKVKIETFYGKPSLGSNHRLLRLRTTKTRCSTAEPSTNPKKIVSRTVSSIRVPFFGFVDGSAVEHRVFVVLSRNRRW